MVALQIAAQLLCLPQLPIDVPSVVLVDVVGIPEFVSPSVYGGSGLLTADGKAVLRPRLSMETHSDTTVAFTFGEQTAELYELAQILTGERLILGTKRQFMYEDQHGTLPAGRWTRVDHQVLDAASIDSVTIAHSDWGGDLESMSERVGGISRISLTARDASRNSIVYRPAKGSITHAVASRDGSEFLARVSERNGVELDEWRIISVKGAARRVSFPKDWIGVAFDSSKLFAVLSKPDSSTLALYDFKTKKMARLPTLESDTSRLRLVALGETLLASTTIASYELMPDRTWRKVASAPILAASRNGYRLLLRRSIESAVLVERNR